MHACMYVYMCSTLVCEMTTPSLHSQISRMQTGLLLRLNAIVRNPLPFWLKILEKTSFVLLGLLLLSLAFSLDSDGICSLAILLRVLVRR